MEKRRILLLGLGALTAGPFIKAMNESSSLTPVLITSEKSKIGNKVKPVYVNGTHEYDIFPLTEEDFREGKEPEDGQILAAAVSDEFIIDLIKASSCCISACREGLHKTYSPIIEKAIGEDRNYHVYSFDNDPSHVKKAEERKKNASVNYYKGMVHAVAMDIKTAEDAIYIECQNEPAVIVFPPQASKEEIGIRTGKNSTFVWKPQVSIAKNNEEMHTFVYEKAMLNTHHSVHAIVCASKGNALGDDILTVESKRWKDYYGYKEMVMRSAQVLLILYTAHFYTVMTGNSTAEQIRHVKEFEYTLGTTTNFVHTIFNSSEKIERALTIRKPCDAKAKLERHMGLLKASVELSKKTEAQDMVAAYLKKLNRLVSTDDFSKAIDFCNKVIEDAEVYYKL